jgi:3-phenylpropionate/cinnamic acid dioxygenase small subunit
MSESELDELKRRVAQLEDERRIRDLIGRYAHFADLGHEEAWAGQFTEDGVYDLVSVVRAGVGYAGPVRFEGREALLRLIRDPAAHKAMEGRSLHIQDMNLVVRVTGDDAVAESYTMTLLREGDETVLRSAGMVRWTLRRTGGNWRITEKRRRPAGDRDLYPDIAPPAPAERP